MTTERHLSPEEIRALYRSTQAEFHTLVNSVSEEEWRGQSLNPGWSNGEIIVHILFGFTILNALLPMARFWGSFPPETSRPFANLLNALTTPFNWINALGARGQGKVVTYRNVGKLYDQVHAALISKTNSLHSDDWQKGMHYPTRWDPNFSEFMTLEKLFLYPIAHFKFHQQQIAHR